MKNLESKLEPSGAAGSRRKRTRPIPYPFFVKKDSSEEESANHLSLDPVTS